MRILFPLGSVYPATLGGPSLSIYNLASALKENGHEPVILSTSKGIKSMDNLDYNFEVHIQGFRLSHKFSIRYMIRLWELIKTADLIHVTSVLYFHSFAAIIFSNLLRKKYIISPRGELFDSAINNSPLKKIYLNAIKFFFKRAKAFHVTSQKEAGVAKPYSDTIYDIPNLFADIHHNESGKVKKTHFLYMGRLHPIKCIENLIHGYALIDTDIPLVIAGDGELPYKIKLMNLVRSKKLETRVIFKGHVKGEEKTQIYQEAVCTVLPSASENFGNVVVESLQNGTPVIASTGTPWSILDVKNCGFYISNESQEISKTLDIFISMPKEKYALMSKNGYLLYKAQYRHDAVIEKYLLMYKNINRAYHEK